MDFKELPRMIDLSCVKTEIEKREIDDMAALAKKYGFICCFAMPAYTPYLIDLLRDDDRCLVGGVVGFPSGADYTSVKVATAKEHLKNGCDELDMVINVTALLSGEYEKALDDIKAVHEAADGHPLKVILEVAYLDDYQVQKGAELAVAGGAAFVKTGTGWGPRPTTVEHIKLIKSVVGDDAKIKAAGGVRSLETIEEMVKAGCSRFGIGVRSSEKILKDAGLWVD